MSRIVVTVPCYNEEKRLDADAFGRLARHKDIHLMFVDDGSTDGTLGRLREICERSPRKTSFFSIRRNQGKAEAVRQGMLKGLQQGADVVGYTDADLSTPVDEIVRLARELERLGAQAVLGARVSLLGSEIHRSPARHYLGRVFATFASLLLELHVYDTQCGAKLFRCSPALGHALSDKFAARWAFDVELIGRLLAGGPGAEPVPPETIHEVPLRKWTDVAGSKVGPLDAVGMAFELARIKWDLRRRVRARVAPSSRDDDDAVSPDPDA